MANLGFSQTPGRLVDTEPVLAKPKTSAPSNHIKKKLIIHSENTKIKPLNCSNKTAR